VSCSHRMEGIGDVVSTEALLGLCSQPQDLTNATSLYLTDIADC
jgi:hypothetical protein